MSKQPLYPHVPKSRKKGERIKTTEKEHPLSRLPFTKGAEVVPPEYQHLTGWVSEPLPRDAY